MSVSDHGLEAPGKLLTDPSPASVTPVTEIQEPRGAVTCTLLGQQLPGHLRLQRQVL